MAPDGKKPCELGKTCPCDELADELDKQVWLADAMTEKCASLAADLDAAENRVAELTAQLAAPAGAMPSWVRPVIYAILESGKIAASGDNAAHYDVYDRVNRLVAHAAPGGEVNNG